MCTWALFSEDSTGGALQFGMQGYQMSLPCQGTSAALVYRMVQLVLLSVM